MEPEDQVRQHGPMLGAGGLISSTPKAMTARMMTAECWKPSKSTTRAKAKKSPSNGGMASSGSKARSDLPWKDRERERRPQLCPLAIRRHAGSPWHQAVRFQAGYGAPAFWRLDQNREQWKEGPSLQKVDRKSLRGGNPLGTPKNRR